MDPEDRALVNIAKGSKSYVEYLFRCNVLELTPRCEYEYEVNHWGYELVPDPQRPGEFLQHRIREG